MTSATSLPLAWHRLTHPWTFLAAKQPFSGCFCISRSPFITLQRPSSSSTRSNAVFYNFRGPNCFLTFAATEHCEFIITVDFSIYVETRLAYSSFTAITWCSSIPRSIPFPSPYTFYRPTFRFLAAFLPFFFSEFPTAIHKNMFLAANFLYTESPVHPTKVAAKNTFLQ